MTNDKPRTPLRANPRLRTGHLEPIKCSCPTDCPIPHGGWLIAGGRS